MPAMRASWHARMLIIARAQSVDTVIVAQVGVVHPHSK